MFFFVFLFLSNLARNILQMYLQMYLRFIGEGWGRRNTAQYTVFFSFLSPKLDSLIYQGNLFLLLYFSFLCSFSLLFLFFNNNKKYWDEAS